MKWIGLIWIFLLSGFTFAQGVLLESEWQFKKSGTDKWHGATVPGTVHTDLFEAGIIGDPFADMNETEQQWIERENWEYRTEFKVNGSVLKQEKIVLVFEGLDTYAAVYLNDSLILEADNMFRSWQINVKGILKKKSNEMRVVFTSPILKKKDVAAAYLPLPAGSDTTQNPVAPFTRKAAYHFGWDWAPRFVTMGIWKDIRIHTWNRIDIKDVYYDAVQIDSKEAKIVGHITIDSDTTKTVGIAVGEFYSGTLDLQKGPHQYPFTFDVSNPKIWWPNGSGEAHLYELICTLSEKKKILDTHAQKFGIRSIELVNEPDSIGTSFFFKVNGEPIFMQGANYVPQDVFLPRVDSSQYITLLTQVRDANMNMIRVWGGGIYERDLFYELCDEYGILVWQDFMFAGSLYPADEAFLENVKTEATEQIIRLRKHPCLALWCGNNEIEVAWNNWGWQKQFGYSSADSTKLWTDYQTLFEGLLPQLVDSLNPQTAYVPTSPQSNWGTPENFNHGSMHYWGVWHGDDYFDGFKKNIGRFMVEYGFQSYPDYDLLAEYISEAELNLSSATIRTRQKSYVGNAKILDFILEYQNAIPIGFKETVMASQEVQALGVAMAMEAHKAAQPHCMGSLMWQLNDCWPGPSWSLINYNGKPKVAYETVKEVLTK